MPSLTFEVESYTVLATQAGNTANGAWRNLYLTSPNLGHGIRSRASVYFFEGGSTTLGVVVNVDQPNYNGLTAYSYCRKADFADWYDMLRNERPVNCTCHYAGPDYDPNQPNRQLSSIQLYTGAQEPPGEGPEGVQSMQLPESVIDFLRSGQ